MWKGCLECVWFMILLFFTLMTVVGVGVGFDGDSSSMFVKEELSVSSIM